MRMNGDVNGASMTEERFVQSLKREKRMGKECRSTQKGYGLAGSDEYTPISGFDCLKRVGDRKNRQVGILFSGLLYNWPLAPN